MEVLGIVQEYHSQSPFGIKSGSPNIRSYPSFVKFHTTLVRGNTSVKDSFGIMTSEDGTLFVSIEVGGGRKDKVFPFSPTRVQIF